MSGHGIHHWKWSFSWTFITTSDDIVLCWLSPGKVSLLFPVSNFKRTQFGTTLLIIWLVVATVIITFMTTVMDGDKSRIVDIPIEQPHKSQNAPVPRSKIHYSEKNCARDSVHRMWIFNSNLGNECRGANERKIISKFYQTKSFVSFWANTHPHIKINSADKG